MDNKTQDTSKKWQSGMKIEAGMYYDMRVTFMPNTTQVTGKDSKGNEYDYPKTVITDNTSGVGRFKTGQVIGVDDTGRPVQLSVTGKLGNITKQKDAPIRQTVTAL